MTIDTKTQLSELVKSIKGHKPCLEMQARRLQDQEILINFDKTNSRCWCLSALGDSLVRVSLFLEQNFNFVETIGVVAISRYLFELSVWLKLFEQDERYGLVYYKQLLETQEKYYRDHRSQLRREVDMLKQFESYENIQIQNKVKMTDLKDVGNVFKSVSQTIDAEAARQFSLYEEQAKINGYGFQAFLVETKALPQVEEALKEIELELEYFNINLTPNITDLVYTKKRWEWKTMAQKVNLQSEYDYIYTFASKLLHANPVSITTNQKNLESEEMLMFLKYINVKIIDMINIARRYPHDRSLGTG